MGELEMVLQHRRVLFLFISRNLFPTCLVNFQVKHQSHGPQREVKFPEGDQSLARRKMLRDNCKGSKQAC